MPVKNTEFNIGTLVPLLLKFVIFIYIYMQDLSKYDIVKLLNSLDREPKYEVIQELPSWGIMNSVTEEQAHSVYMIMCRRGFDINLFGEKGNQNDKDGDLTTIFWNESNDKERVSPHRDVCAFDDYFKIKEKYKGWEDGLKYGI